jgi:hypothetical protein
MLTAIIIGLLIILIGAIFCLFGYRLFIYLLPVWGFVAGFLMGAQGVATIIGEGFLATLTGWTIGVLLGLFMALISYFLFEFAIYLFATTFGLAVGAGFMYALGIESGLLVAIAALVGAIVLIVLVAFLDVKKWLIVALTAFGGATAILAGILTILGKVSLTGIQAGANPVSSTVEDSLLWVVVWLGVGVAGIVFQARTTKDFFIDEGYTYYHQLLERRKNDSAETGVIDTQTSSGEESTTSGEETEESETPEVGEELPKGDTSQSETDTSPT